MTFAGRLVRALGVFVVVAAWCSLAYGLLPGIVAGYALANLAMLAPPCVER